MTTTEILADLRTDDDLKSAVQNLEATYLNPLEVCPDLGPIAKYRLIKARDALWMALDALQRLAECDNRNESHL